VVLTSNAGCSPVSLRLTRQEVYVVSFCDDLFSGTYVEIDRNAAVAESPRFLLAGS
jgi:hypothetical protein